MQAIASDVPFVVMPVAAGSLSILTVCSEELLHKNNGAHCLKQTGAFYNIHSQM